MYTKEVLEQRLTDLESMHEELSALEQGFVGGDEILTREMIMESYDFDHEHWFSDRSEIESVLFDMERAV